MDTDELSIETYTAVIGAAEQFDHDLVLHFGVLAMDCDTEDDFLEESEAIINEWLHECDLEEVILDVFFDNPPGKPAFKKILVQILKNIDAVNQIPPEKRTYEPL